jgi:hypothetical protein
MKSSPRDAAATRVWLVWSRSTEVKSPSWLQGRTQRDVYCDNEQRKWRINYKYIFVLPRANSSNRPLCVPVHLALASFGGHGPNTEFFSH